VIVVDRMGGVVAFLHLGNERLYRMHVDQEATGFRVGGEFPKSRGDRRLVKAATVLLPSV
jgi:hypothetical protein